MFEVRPKQPFKQPEKETYITEVHYHHTDRGRLAQRSRGALRRRCKIRLKQDLNGEWESSVGARAGEKMNMHVHIYPEK